jgi:hypothetical protein
MLGSSARREPIGRERKLGAGAEGGQMSRKGCEPRSPMPTLELLGYLPVNRFLQKFRMGAKTG